MHPTQEDSEMYDTLWKMIKSTAGDGNLRVLTEGDLNEDDPREWLYALDLAETLKPEDSSLN